MMKVYETVNDVRLITTISLGSINVAITFDGGTSYPVWRPGRFQTEDKALQKAIEASPSFDKSYVLCKIKREKVNKIEVELKNIDDVKNKQQAIEWIRLNLNIKFKEVPDELTLRQMGVENGYSFLNWKNK